jgi:tricorn protease
MKIKHVLSIAFIALLSAFTVKAQDDARLMRFPDINKDLIAFVYAGDIWTVPADGGDATRLTSHMGRELFPKISPDGKWIAFSAEYSGSRQVYIIPAEGGSPKQLTWYNDAGMMPPRGGFDNVILDWTPDSKKILVRMNRTPFGERNGKYFYVNIDGGLEEPLQITEGGFGVLSPDASKICFAPISREFRTWKRYKGGRAADLWVYDLNKDEAEAITDFVGTDQIPVWYKDKIYFASDRDLILNIYSYDVNTKDVKQLTTHKEFDVMWPAGENGQIAYENGGYIYKLNLETGANDRVKVNITFDNPNILPYYKNVKGDIDSWNVSPGGERALFDARGDIFSVPAKNGEIINLTNTQGVREMYPSWSPDGKYISYVSDKTGEYEIYLLENKEGAEAKQLTKGSTAWKYTPIWSPDSKYLVYSDRTLDLKILNVESGKSKKIDQGLDNELRTYSFSHDSKWVTYTKSAENGQSAIFVYNIDKAKSHKITDDTFNDMSPAFSKDGNYIYFTSNRDFNLDFSSFEFDYLYNNATRIYALALRKDSPKLFADKVDVVKVKDEAKEEEKKDEEKEDGLTIDFDGIASRVTPIPLPNGGYGALQGVDGGFIYSASGAIHKFSIDSEESKKIVSGAWAYELTADGKKMMYAGGGKYGIISLSPGQKAGAGKLDLSNMEMKIDPRTEWNQIYKDGWRIFRDFFYVENLHNVDWVALREKYEALLPYVSHRGDLDYIFGEIIAETNTGHAYVNYGDFAKVKRIETGLLGAEMKADKKAGRYQITKIFAGENWTPNRYSPLTEQGVDVNVGDYLLKINGQELKINDNPYRLLENTVGKKIQIVVNDKASFEGARTYTVKPIKSELELFYLDWVESRRAMVDKLSNGKIGYIHTPNTAVEGNRELHRGMYAYHDKNALIIDDRYNGGGFIPDHMADLLDRETLAWWHRKGLRAFKTPGIAHDGPKAMLINGYSSSGGDAFPYFFRKKGLGTVIGSRTWGGLVGMSGNAGLVDGGYIAVPRFGIYDENEEWIIEGIGVYPDIDVFDAPHKTAKGIDPSVEKAVEVLLQKLKENPVIDPKAPKDPDRKGWIEVDVK